jgi:hypothetical protein
MHKVVCKEKSYIEINHRIKCDLKTEYKYLKFPYECQSREYLTVNDLLDMKGFNKGKRLFSKIEYLKYYHGFDEYKINIEDIKSIELVTERSSCYKLSIDDLSELMPHEEFLNYVSDKLGGCYNGQTKF